MPITGRSLQPLTHPRFLAELHRFFWTPPFLSNGERDFGWHCREHAWVVALLCRKEGWLETYIFHGSAYFLGAVKAAEQRRTVWQWRHTWVGIPDYGFIDLSIKRRNVDPEAGQTLDAGCEGVFLNRLMPRLNRSILFGRDKSEGQAMLDAANCDRRPRAVYVLGDSSYPPIPDDVTNAARWINSPLTERLRQRGDPTHYYCAALLHLASAFDGGPTIPLGKSQEDAWDAALASYPDPIESVLRLVGFSDERPTNAGA